MNREVFNSSPNAPRPLQVLRVTPPHSNDGAMRGECPACRRAIDSLRHFCQCGYCGVELRW